MLLELRDIGMKYPKSDRQVLQNVNLLADEGFFVTVTGASGSGKSTLLAISGGYLKPESGNVIYKEKDLYTLKEKEISKLHAFEIGYVPQSNAMFKKYTIEENILMYTSLTENSEGYEDKNVILCPVCYTNERNSIALPCKHLFCEVCINKLNHKCAICRNNIIFEYKIK